MSPLPVVSSASSSATWTCVACTFENSPTTTTTTTTAARCEICETPRPTATTSTGSRPAGTRTAHKSTNDNEGASAEVMDLLLVTSPSEKAATKKGNSPSRKRNAAAVHSFFVPASQKATAAATATAATSAPRTIPRYTLPSTRSFSSAAIQIALQQFFGLQSLRPNLQSQAIQNALKQQSQLLVLATGGGKSLCFQLPACLLGGVSIVISPLLALMQDQVHALQRRGIPAALVSSQQTAQQNQHILDRLVDNTSTDGDADMDMDMDANPLPHTKKTKTHHTNKNKKKNETQQEGPITLLYITPESIQTDRMRKVLNQLHQQKRLTMFAVDEAHCLSRYVLLYYSRSCDDKWVSFCGTDRD